MDNSPGQGVYPAGLKNLNKTSLSYLFHYPDYFKNLPEFKLSCKLAKK
jgi:hypothetical protein